MEVLGRSAGPLLRPALARRTFVEHAAYACATAGLHPRDAALLSGHEVDHGMKVIATFMQNAPYGRSEPRPP